jgi:hypothetical protein
VDGTGLVVGTDPTKVKSPKLPVGVFSTDARVTLAGALPDSGIFEVTQLEA